MKSLNLLYLQAENISFTSFLFLSGSYTIQGRRVQVYQPEYEQPWAFGLVSQHDPVSHIMEITMDQSCLKVSMLPI